MAHLPASGALGVDGRGFSILQEGPWPGKDSVGGGLASGVHPGAHSVTPKPPKPGMTSTQPGQVRGRKNHTQECESPSTGRLQTLRQVTTWGRPHRARSPTAGALVYSVRDGQLLEQERKVPNEGSFFPPASPPSPPATRAGHRTVPWTPPLSEAEAALSSETRLSFLPRSLHPFFPQMRSPEAGARQTQIKLRLHAFQAAWPKARHLSGPQFPQL